MVWPKGILKTFYCNILKDFYEPQISSQASHLILLNYNLIPYYSLEVTVFLNVWTWYYYNVKKDISLVFHNSFWIILVGKSYKEPSYITVITEKKKD